MFTSLRFRLWLTYALVVGVVIAVSVAAVVVYLLSNPTEDRRELQRLRLVANLIVQRGQLLNAGSAPGPAHLQEAAERADSTLGVRIAVFDSSGELQADSRLGQESPLPTWAALNRRSRNGAGLFRDEQLKQWLYFLSPLENGQSLLVSAPRARTPVLSVLRDEFLWPFLRAVLLALFLSLALAFGIARWVTAPLQRMADAARAVSAAQFQKAPLEGPREVQVVAKAFNEMGERMQASQRAQRDFIANVSHDLKTPLTSIQGFAQAILDGTAEQPEAARQAAEVIYSEAGRMHRMVQDLLELARLDSGAVAFQRSALDPGKLLHGVVQKFTPQAQQGQVSLRLSFGDASGDTLPSGYLPEISGDADRLAEVFSNLVDNALKHTPPGGQVVVYARPVENWVETRVADTGPGIPEAELERIFERFYQTDKSRRGGVGRGVGLGLAIAREIVQAHGGSITAQNRSGEAVSGSVFIVRLPMARPNDATLAKRR
ncbi:MAG: HAMP domain-containing histidine kinase [Anaerolineales bacterium]|nr:HAMP domain-containing histidine kinase [Anaerolineales bacterium]